MTETTEVAVSSVQDTLPVPNLALLRRALEQIDAHPETWDQFSFACGTSHCVGGWALILSGHDISFDKKGHYVLDGRGDVDIWDEARTVLGITDNESHALFAPQNTRWRLELAAADIAARAGEEL